MLLRSSVRGEGKEGSGTVRMLRRCHSQSRENDDLADPDAVIKEKIKSREGLARGFAFGWLG